MGLRGSLDELLWNGEAYCTGHRGRGPYLTGYSGTEAKQTGNTLMFKDIRPETEKKKKNGLVIVGRRESVNWVWLDGALFIEESMFDPNMQRLVIVGEKD